MQLNENRAMECLEILRGCITDLQLLNPPVQSILSDLNNVARVMQNSPHPSSRTIIELVTQAAILLQNSNLSVNVGRPKINISTETLRSLLSLGLSIPKIGRLIGVSIRTVKRRLKDSSLSVSGTFSLISDDQLNSTVSAILLQHPNTGIKRMKGYLRAQSIKVTESRLRSTMRTVDPDGVSQRRRHNRAIYRRQYFVQYSMELWHIDTHHKLIRWGIVVRGGIDGKSRTIVYLSAGNNNSAKSNLESFMEGVYEFGVPIRTRSDKGGENLDVARFMLEMRGTNRGSHICGRSVHNQRIERLWRDVHYGCLSYFKAVFTRLEHEGFLNLDNPKHVAVLQWIFIPRIEKCLKEFKNAWNSHPISTEHGSTPLQLMLSNLPPTSYDLSMQQQGNFISSEDPELNAFDLDNLIQLEDFATTLSLNETNILNEIDPLRESNWFGYDVYIDAFKAVFS